MRPSPLPLNSDHQPHITLSFPSRRDPPLERAPRARLDIGPGAGVNLAPVHDASVSLPLNSYHQPHMTPSFPLRRDPPFERAPRVFVEESIPQPGCCRCTIQ